jgi:hypothetical protein
MGTETCPSCNNQGPHVAVMCGPNGCRETIRACDFCGGLGIVEVEAADLYRKGAALREKRVHKLGLTQEQYAHILKIDPRFLNDIECGRANMPDTVDRRLLEEL